MWKKLTKAGKICYCERYMDPFTGKKRDVSIVYEKDTPKNRKEAAQLLAKKIEKQLGPTTSELRLSGLVDLYLEDQKNVVKDSTYVRNKYATSALTKILSGDVLVDRLTAAYVRRRFLDSGKSAATLNELLQRFKAMIKWAYRSDLIPSIMFLEKLHAFPDVPHRVKIQDKFMESSELDTVLKAMTVPAWKLLTEFLALSGLRIGEALALTVDDIDFDEHVIHINKTYDYINKLTTSTKTAASSDDLIMQPQLEDVVKRTKAFFRRQALANQYRSRLLFQSEDGSFAHYYAYCKYLRENAEAITGKKLTPHSLRHTHASLLFEQGFTLEEVSRRLRHADSRVTKDVYIHVTARLKERDAEKLRKVNLL